MSIINAIVSINLLAVFTALIAHFVTGILWYSPLMFGRFWKKSGEADNQPKKQIVLIGIGYHFIYTYALAVVLKLVQAERVIDGLITALVLAVGIIAPILANENIYRKPNTGMFFFKLGDELLALCASSVILVLWK